MKPEAVAIYAEIESLEDQLRDAARRLCEAAEFKVDEVVEARQRGTWHPVIVRRVFTYQHALRYSVSRQNKDGAWSKQWFVVNDTALRAKGVA